MKNKILKELIELIMEKYTAKKPNLGHRDPNMSLVSDEQGYSFKLDSFYYIWYVKPKLDNNK